MICGHTRRVRSSRCSDGDTQWRRSGTLAAVPSLRHRRCAAGVLAAAAATPSTSGVKSGLFVCSGSPAIAEALAHSGLDWICLDAQHGAVSYATLHDLLAATSGAPARRIVRVGGPDDRYGMQQALE